jgi:hypothetical protein
MKRADLRRWAVVGAQQRLADIASEQRAIFAAFPELRRSGSRSGAPSGGDAESQPPNPKRRRRRMSKEARKRISDAQKARWAKQKATQRK